MKRSILVLFVLLAFCLLGHTDIALALGGTPPPLSSTIEVNTVSPVVSPEVAKPLIEVSPFKPATGEVKTLTPPPSTLTAKGSLYRVRTGLFSKKESAQMLSAELSTKGYTSVVVSQAGFYRVQVGAFKNPKGAEALAADLREKGYTVDIIVSD